MMKNSVIFVTTTAIVLALAYFLMVPGLATVQEEELARSEEVVTSPPNTGSVELLKVTGVVFVISTVFVYVRGVALPQRQGED